MKRFLITLLLCALSLPVLANDVTKTLKTGIEKSANEFTDFFIYEEFLKSPKSDKGHAFEVFGYNASNNRMCNLYVINLSEKYGITFSDNSMDNICFRLNKTNNRIYAVDYNKSDYYFYRKEILYFENNFNSIHCFQKSLVGNNIQDWQGTQVSQDKMLKSIQKNFNKTKQFRY